MRNEPEEFKPKEESKSRNSSGETVLVILVFAFVIALLLYQNAPRILSWQPITYPRKVCYPPCFINIPSRSRYAVWITQFDLDVTRCWGNGYWPIYITEQMCRQKGGVWDWERISE